MLVTPIVFGGLLLGPTAVDATDKDDRSTDPARGLADPGGMSGDGPGARGCAARPPVRGPSAGQLDSRFHPSPLDDLRPALPRGRHPFDRDIDVAGCRGGGRRRGPGSPRLAGDRASEGSAARHRSTCPRRRARSSVSADRSAGVRSRRPAANRPNHARSTRSSAEAEPRSAIVKAISAVSTWRGSSPPSAASPSRPSRSTVAAPGSGRRPPIRWLPTLGASRRRCPAAPTSSSSASGSRVGRRPRRRPKRARPSSASTGVPAPPWSACRPNEDGGWVVLVQSTAGSAEIATTAVIVATGAYFEPREHRSIAGGRPAGVMTS